MERCARRWGLALDAPFAPSYGWVAPGRRGGEAIVLKLGVEPGGEAAALRAYRGDGAVRLLDEAPGEGALLLERLEPGAELATLVPERDDEATDAIAGLLARLWREPPPGLPPATLAAYRADLEAAAPAGPLTAALLRRARAVWDALAASAPEPVLLHGDLHHHNVLSARRAPWLAIDPHGLVGDPGYDLAPCLYNPLGEADPGARAERRVGRLARELCLDRDRARAWGFAGAVLSAAWTASAGGRIDERALGVARRLWVSEP